MGMGRQKERLVTEPPSVEVSVAAAAVDKAGVDLRSFLAGLNLPRLNCPVLRGAVKIKRFASAYSRFNPWGCITPPYMVIGPHGILRGKCSVCGKAVMPENWLALQRLRNLNSDNRVCFCGGSPVVPSIRHSDVCLTGRYEARLDGFTGRWELMKTWKSKNIDFSVFCALPDYELDELNRILSITAPGSSVFMLGRGGNFEGINGIEAGII